MSLRQCAGLVPKAWLTRALPKKARGQGNWAGAEVLRHHVVGLILRRHINSGSALTVPAFGFIFGSRSKESLVQRGSGLAGAVTYAIERLRRRLPRGGVQHVRRALCCPVQGVAGCPALMSRSFNALATPIQGIRPAPLKGIDLLANQERGYVFGSDSSSNRAKSPAF